MNEKLTQQQIEARLAKRAEEVRNKVRKIEISMMKTRKTMNLRFIPVINNYEEKI